MLKEFGLTKVVTNDDYVAAGGEQTDGLMEAIQQCEEVDYTSHFAHAPDLQAYDNFLRILHKFPDLKLPAEDDEKKEEVGWCNPTLP